MKPTFRFVDPDPKLLEKFKPLWEANFRESPIQPWWPLDLDVARYMKLWEMGLLKVYLAEVAGDMVGYQVYLVANHGHHQTVLTAQCEVFFMLRKVRGYGVEFLSWCETQLGGIGVEFIMHENPKGQHLDVLLARRGYLELTTKWGKRLDQHHDQTRHLSNP